MTEMDVRYMGNLRCHVTHVQSGVELETDAPKDNHGLGESFSPTDLLATALGSCMLTVMGIAARRLEVNLTGATAHVQKEMTSTAPRQVKSLTVSVRGPGSIAADMRKKLEEAALTCPVHHSLHPNVQVAIEFSWDG